MDLGELVRGLLRDDGTSVREWVLERRLAASPPEGLDAIGMAVAAGLTELLAEQLGQAPPAWTATIGQAPEDVYLPPRFGRRPHSRAMCEEESPPPLRLRRIYARAGFLSVA